MATALTWCQDYDSLINEVLAFTGSTDTAEIQRCIRLTELMMRKIELPALRSDPYDPAFHFAADSDGFVPIPTDMLKPILFFQAGPTNTGTPNESSNTLGPWIVYDRVGDREVIRRQLIENQYLKPFNIPAVYRGSFSEVGDRYIFNPTLSAGTIISMYYYRVWPFLGTTTADNPPLQVISNVVLQSFPEGYFYGTLYQYYLKKKNTEEAAKWKASYDEAYGLIEDQNFKGKWAGGTTKLYSNFQPRRQRYTYK